MTISARINSLLGESRILFQALGSLNSALNEALLTLRHAISRIAESSDPDESALETAESNFATIRTSLLEMAISQPLQRAHIQGLFAEARKAMSLNLADNARQEECVQQYLEDITGIYEQVRKAVDYFSLMPAEIIQNILNRLDLASLRRFSQVSSASRRDVEAIPLPHVFYAVGTPINLYGSFSDILSGVSSAFSRGAYYSSVEYSPRSYFTAGEMADTLFHYDNMMRLFPNFAAARLYCHFNTPERYNASYDVFFPYETPAIYLVRLKSGVQLQSMRIRLREDWLDAAPAPPRPKTAVLGFYASPASNLDEVIACRFDAGNPHRLFGIQNPAGSHKSYPRVFAEAWNDFASSEGGTFAQWLKTALTRLFGTYSAPFYASLTRHHHQKVTEILTFLAEERTTSEVSEYLTRMRDSIQEDINYKTTGSFVLMLDFSLEKLNACHEAASLGDINQFMSVRCASR